LVHGPEDAAAAAVLSVTSVAYDARATAPATR
jgi:hypothetical protein